MDVITPPPWCCFCERESNLYESQRDGKIEAIKVEDGFVGKGHRHRSDAVKGASKNCNPPLRHLLFGLRKPLWLLLIEVGGWGGRSIQDQWRIQKRFFGGGHVLLQRLILLVRHRAISGREHFQRFGSWCQHCVALRWQLFIAAAAAAWFVPHGSAMLLLLLRAKHTWEALLLGVVFFCCVCVNQIEQERVFFLFCFLCTAKHNLLASYWVSHNTHNTPLLVCCWAPFSFPSLKSPSLT